MDDAESFLAENTFYCERLRARITQQACSDNRAKPRHDEKRTQFQLARFGYNRRPMACDGCTDWRNPEDKSMSKIGTCKRCRRTSISLPAADMCGRCYKVERKGICQTCGSDDGLCKWTQTRDGMKFLCPVCRVNEELVPAEPETPKGEPDTIGPQPETIDGGEPREMNWQPVACQGCVSDCKYKINRYSCPVVKAWAHENEPQDALIDETIEQPMVDESLDPLSAMSFEQLKCQELVAKVELLRRTHDRLSAPGKPPHDTASNPRVMADFSGYEDVLKFLFEAANEEVRRPEQQIVWILKNWMEQELAKA